ncbi:MAG: hypothetical protein U5K72_14730 [Balneolaceae bacterium]|nr:hypothetical protein [Balneolaceae bacterium]
MKRKSYPYKILTKSAALLLVIGLLLPSALQAKQLVDFCMMEMNHHEMMGDSHDCCISDRADHEATHKNHHDCEGVQICACSVDTSVTNNQFRVPTAESSAVILSRIGFQYMVTSPDEFLYEDYFAVALEHFPPLYLQYDTFLK